jgi:hypothetical protein
MPQVVVAHQVRSRTLDAPSYAASLMSDGGASMDSPHVFFQLAEIVDRLRCIALSISQRLGVRLRDVKRMASQVDMAAFRLSGRGVF